MHRSFGNSRQLWWIRLSNDLFGRLRLPNHVGIVLEEGVLEQVERYSFEEVELPMFILDIRDTVVLFHESVYMRFVFFVSFLSVEEILGNWELVCNKGEADEGTNIRSPLGLWL